jgi:hypothetical protein
LLRWRRGLDYSTVSREQKRLREKMDADRDLKRLVEKAEQSLNQK